MKILPYSSAEEVLSEIGKRFKALRISIPLSQAQVSDLTGISVRTIVNLEAGKDVSFSTIIAVMRALGILQSLDAAIPEQDIRPSQILELGKPRVRVRKKNSEPTAWKWGDEK